MTTIGSKSRSNKDKSVDSEKSEARTTTMESWADAMQNQVTLRERKKLVKGYADFIGTSETVVESVREQLGVHSKCSERQKDVIVKPMKEFVSELTKRYNELSSGKWERVVMRIMRENGLEKLEDLRDAVLPDDLTASKKKEIQSRNKEKIQVHSRRSSSRSSNGSSVDWRDERKERKTGESFSKKCDLKNDRSEDGRVKVKNWEVKSSVGDFPEGSVRVSERRKCERDSERCSRVSRNSSRIMVECLSRMIRASALPEPEKFDGKGDVKEFKRSFILKYKSVTECDADMVAILEDKFLKDAARTLFKTLPNRFNRSIDSLFKEFEEKLRRRQGDREVEALNEFEDLERKQKQPMWEFLMSVEKWSKRAFPHLEEETLSQLRVTKLMRALRDDPTMQKLMTMKRYEVAKKDQYEFLKDIVLQQENEDKRRQGLGKSDRHEKKENSWKKKRSEAAKQENSEEKKEGSEAGSQGNRSESESQRRARLRCKSDKCKSIKKTIIKEPAVIASPRLKISGRRNILEVRNSHGSDFMEKYEWKKVKNVLWLWRVTKDEKVNQRIFELIEKLAEEVPEVIMVPFKLECVMKEVDEVTEEWRKRLKTLNNVKLIDPKKEVGKRKMPLIGTSSDAYESKESLVRYLEQVAKDNPCVKRLKAMSAEKEQPRSKMTKSDK
ncbi:Protein CBG10620 [Caenorhabditis briggsae]|uniref:Protein CBG10620 n=1 Tax=Caenorhabditis briggsae TaxID=6238 RepID=A8XBH2_CAEBR|nr:Protein CBG10620 [Caenorhabditis briggsae]CAP29987.2 Protein CBG10620 [Caenorhabditis briggsae]